MLYLFYSVLRYDKYTAMIGLTEKCNINSKHQYLLSYTGSNHNNIGQRCHIMSNN